MRRSFLFFCNAVIICLLFCLPYYIFQGKLFVGGDDTRLQYVFPWEYLQHFSFFSWNNISSVSYYVPNQFSIPFVLVWSLLENIFRSRAIVDYIAFSLPLVLGFSYFQLFIKKLLPQINWMETMVGALFFILSPIILQTQLSVFLTSVWLLGLIPIVGYYLLLYIESKNKIYMLFASLWCLFLSMAVYAIPWIFGLVLPLLAGLLFSIFFYPKKKILLFLKDTVLFFSAILATQIFWIIPFVTTFVGGGNNLGTKALSTSVAASFRSTVLATAIGNVWYPLLNLFHRQIIETFEWQTKSIFENFYDKIGLINISYIILIIASLLLVAKKADDKTKKLYFIFFFIFLLTLYLFTVNLGPFKQVFLLGGYVPGFVMFRNFYDKFAIGFVFLYTVIISYSLFILRNNYPKIARCVLVIILLVILVNALPIKNLVNSPLWTTENSYRVIIFPNEYMNFLSKIKTIVSPSTNIVSLPFNIAAYTVIKEDGTNNVYAGTSPLKILTGINDYSGDLSFSSQTAGQIDIDLQNKNYTNLTILFKKYNASYVFVTKNIPSEVNQSYLFAAGLKLKDQTNEFISAITDGPVLVSERGNYVLYKIKQDMSTISFSGGSVVFKKISPVEYILNLSHIPEKSVITLHDSFHNGWGLFIAKQSLVDCKDEKQIQRGNVRECLSGNVSFSLSDILFLWNKQIFTSSHRPTGEFGQSWSIDTKFLQHDFPNNITHNNDGTVNATLILYFRPQVYFYAGSIMTICALCILIFLVIKAKFKK